MPNNLAGSPFEPYPFETCILEVGRTTSHHKHPANFRTVRNPYSPETCILEVGRTRLVSRWFKLV